MTRIGLAYVKGSVPGFEHFGNLPTDIVKENGLVNGNKASDELDALIIPGGTLIESNDINMDLNSEIKKMARDGRPIIGICAGFQLLSNQIDIGRKSEVPIIKEGLGLIDVEFSPLITSDKVKAKVIDNSFLTKNQKDDITGFHTHTYGKVSGDAKKLFYSQVQRMNYKDTNEENKYNILSGACSDDGNVIGTMIHNILDENPIIKQNLLNQIDVKDIDEIYNRNNEVKQYIKSEVGVNTNIKIPEIEGNKKPKFLMIGSNGSDSGKTFILTGLAGALTKRGYKVGLLKVGPDVRDIIPGLYLTKGLMEEYASVKIGHLGWSDIESTIYKLNSSDYDIILIEGVMSVFTGLLNEKTPFSAAEIAASSDIPMLLISGVNKGGIESAAIDLVAHANVLEKFNIDVKGILLNKVYNDNIFNSIIPYIKNNTAVDKVLKVDKLKLKTRGFTPEIEIKYDLFTESALDLVEKSLNIDDIIDMTEEVEFNHILGFNEIKEKVI